MATTVIAVSPRKRSSIAMHEVLRLLVVVTPILVLALYFGISAYVADKLSHPARNLPQGTPAQYGLSYEDVTFNSAVDNIPLNGWYIDSPGDQVIVMAHGRDFSRTANGGLEKAAVLAGHRYDVLMFDFRAHGLSGGERYSMGSWETRDIAGALNYLRARSVTEVGAYGISLGASTQIMAAAEHPEIKAIVSEAAYADLPALLDYGLTRNSGLPAFFNRGILSMAQLMYGMDFSHARSTKSISELGSRPILLIHSEQDEFVPVSNVHQLAQAGAANPNLTTWVVPTGAHCELFSTYKEEYTRRMLQFYDCYLQPAELPVMAESLR